MRDFEPRHLRLVYMTTFARTSNSASNYNGGVTRLDIYNDFRDPEDRLWRAQVV